MLAATDKEADKRMLPDKLSVYPPSKRSLPSAAADLNHLN
jgi:hypothetical protein